MMIINIYFGWFRKKFICCVARQLRRCGAPVSAPHSSVFARLASGAFYETINFDFSEEMEKAAERSHSGPGLDPHVSG
jgi:hypothetical protein